MELQYFNEDLMQVVLASHLFNRYNCIQVSEDKCKT